MTKEETLAVVNEIIDESTKAMRAEAEMLLNAQEWDFNIFGDRNTFARTVMEAIFDKEKKQYAAINNTRTYKELKIILEYELSFIHAQAMKFHVSNIKYDTDGYNVELPTEMDVECEYEYEIADEISDKTGWLVNSFEIK